MLERSSISQIASIEGLGAVIFNPDFCFGSWLGCGLGGLWEGGQHQTKPRISGFGLLQHKPNPGFLGWFGDGAVWGGLGACWGSWEGVWGSCKVLGSFGGQKGQEFGVLSERSVLGVLGGSWQGLGGFCWEGLGVFGGFVGECWGLLGGCWEVLGGVSWGSVWRGRAQRHPERPQVREIGSG